MHKYIRNPEIVSANIDQELVMLDIQQGKYFSLNPVACRIWEILEQGHTQQELCEILIDEFDVGQEQCLNEVAEHLKEMKNYKLIQ